MTQKSSPNYNRPRVYPEPKAAFPSDAEQPITLSEEARHKLLQGVLNDIYGEGFGAVEVPPTNVIEVNFSSAAVEQLEPLQPHPTDARHQRAQ